MGGREHDDGGKDRGGNAGEGNIRQQIRNNDNYSKKQRRMLLL